jgi:HEPN domain-containing protein
MIEKLLKAGLVNFRGDIPFIHDLTRLAQLLSAHVPDIEELFSGELKTISEYYVTTRYPSDVPLESFHWEMAEQAFAAAERVAERVRNALKLK